MNNTDNPLNIPSPSVEMSTVPEQEETKSMASIPSVSIMDLYPENNEDEEAVGTPDDMKDKHKEHEDHEHEHEHEHEHIFISKKSKFCGWCGFNDSSLRAKVFDVVENWELQCCSGTILHWTFSIPKFLMFLLIVDLIFVAVEIALLYRLIAPAAGLGTSSLYQPREYICAYTSKAKTMNGATDSVKECCELFSRKYNTIDIWDTGHTGDDPINIQTCMRETLWDNTTITSSSGGSSASSATTSSTSGSAAHRQRQRRMLLESAAEYTTYPIQSFTSQFSDSSRQLSAAHHDTQLSRCYADASGKYMVVREHLPIEVFFHWGSTAILIIFFIELLTILYSMRIQQFFCGCRRPVAVHDPVYIVDQHTGDIVCSYGIANHVNGATGSVTVIPLHNVNKDQRAELRDAMKDTNGLQMMNVVSTYPSKASATSTKQKRNQNLKRRRSASKMKVEEMERQTFRHNASIASVVGLDANKLGNKEMLCDVPYWNVFLFIEEDGSDQIYCGTPGRSPFPCSWHNKFFVLDFLIVLVALILENYLEISQSMNGDKMSSTSNDQDVAALTEASVILLLVRGWRFARVLHGFMETTRKLTGETEELEGEMQHRNSNLRDLVQMNNFVEEGVMSDKQFRLKFLEIYSSSSHDYIKEINDMMEEQAKELKEANKIEHSNKRASQMHDRLEKKL